MFRNNINEYENVLTGYVLGIQVPVILILPKSSQGASSERREIDYPESVKIMLKLIFSNESV